MVNKVGKGQEQFSRFSYSLLGCTWALLRDKECFFMVKEKLSRQSAILGTVIGSLFVNTL